jgi:hypothetical protein
MSLYSQVYKTANNNNNNNFPSMVDLHKKMFSAKDPEDDDDLLINDDDDEDEEDGQGRDKAEILASPSGSGHLAVPNCDCFRSVPP